MNFEPPLKINEKEALDEIRERFKNDMEQEMYDDIYLFQRFLKARDFDVDKAETMLKKHLEWRERHDAKNVRNFPRAEFFNKYMPNTIIGYDKDGCIVRYYPLGTIDFAGFFSSLKVDEVMKYVLYFNEYDGVELQKQNKKLGRNVDMCSHIFDLKDLTFASSTDKKVIYNAILLINTYLSNYPEKMKAVYVLNVPAFFSIFQSLMKLLPGTVISKIKMYFDESYKKDLLKAMDADDLPAFLGGNKTDPDGNPLCISFIKRGEHVPEAYYLSNNKRSLMKDPAVQKINLPRAAFHEVNLDVKEGGSFLEWEFETKCRDVGFGLFYQEKIDGEEKITELIPIQRIDTDEYPETGTFRCDIPGSYVIVFDNTYSWVREKEIYFKAKIVTSSQHESAHLE